DLPARAWRQGVGDGTRRAAGGDAALRFGWAGGGWAGLSGHARLQSECGAGRPPADRAAGRAARAALGGGLHAGTGVASWPEKAARSRTRAGCLGATAVGELGPARLYRGRRRRGARTGRPRSLDRAHDMHDTSGARIFPADTGNALVDD